jgi:hypothetical protein
MVVVIYSSETSVITRATRYNISEDGILHLSDSFIIQHGLKQGDAFSRLLYNFALEYAIRKVYSNKLELKLNKIHPLLACADVILMGDNIGTINKNREL